MKRAALYARVSTGEQEKHGTSLQSQMETCRTYAAQHGYTIVLEASDTFTGKTMSRAGMDRVLSAARDGDLDSVVCLKIDRSSRDLYDLLGFDRELKHLAIALEFVEDARETGPAGDLFFHIRGAFAQYEHAVIRDRLEHGLKARIRQGKVLGSRLVALGYTYDREARMLVIDEERAPIVRDIFEWYALEGLTLYKVAQRLNDTGVATSQGALRWQPNAVASIIKNEVYMGKWTWNKRQSVHSEQDRHDPDAPKRSRRNRPRSEWLQVDVPAIVSPELFQAAQERTRDNALYSRRNRRQDYLLASLCKCGVCGLSLHVHTVHHKGLYPATYTHYTCQHAQRTGQGGPHLPFIRAEALDMAVWGEVVRQFTDRAFLEDVLQQEAQTDAALPYERAMADASGELRKIEAEATRITDAYQLGHRTREDFIARMERLRSRRISAESAYKKAEAALHSVQTATERHQALQERVEDIRAGITDRLSIDERRALLVEWRVVITVNPPGTTATIEGLLRPATVPIVPIARKHQNQYTRRKAG